jgi:mannose-6-phosphate isomerase-like protein (cupin superfamily)
MKFVAESLNEFESVETGFFTDIEKDTIENKDFRRVLFTGENMQLVVMTLGPGEDIGEEVHDVDQFFRFEKGTGKVIINETEYNVKDGSSVIIPAGSTHNIINDGSGSLHMYTIYAPPHHKDGTRHTTKEEALAVGSKQEMEDMKYEIMNKKEIIHPLII